MRSFETFCLAVGAVLAVALPARAERIAEGGTNEQWDGGYSLTAERRSGFVASLGFGAGVGSVLGYPNAVQKIDNPDFESNTGAAFSTVNAIWVGGALRDWFTFGLGLMGVGADGDGVQARGSGFIVHIEAFPLWSLGGPLRDLSLYTNMGPGGLVLEGGPEKGDGGLMSFINVGASWELLRLGHFAFGPTLDGVYMYSNSADARGVFAGVRTSFYGGP